MMAQNIRQMLADAFHDNGDTESGIAGSHAVAQALLHYLRTNTR